MSDTNQASEYEKLATDTILSGQASGEVDEKSVLVKKAKKDDHKHLLVFVDGSKFGNEAFEKALRYVHCGLVSFVLRTCLGLCLHTL